jgi:hypothetical protein
MSIGNLKDQGNKGNNFPYQLRTLQLLGEILTVLDSAPKLLQPGVIESTGAAVLGPFSIVYNVSFYNTGGATADLTVNGNTVTIPAGSAVNYDPGVNNYYKASDFSWDATGTTLIIAYTTA